jgi:PAS domain S-box-containing protein
VGSKLDKNFGPWAWASSWMFARGERVVVLAGVGIALLVGVMTLGAAAVLWVASGKDAATAKAPFWMRWNEPMTVGIGALGLTGFILGLGLYRLLRYRMRGLGAIQESLRVAASFETGELPTSGLRLSDDLGDEARAWNRLLEERDTLRQKAALEEAAKRMGGPAGGMGDHASAFDALWTGLAIVDEKGKVRAINGAACVMLGCQKAGAIDKGFLSLTTHEPVQDLVTGVLTGRARQRGSLEVTQRHEGGVETVLRFTVRPMRKEDGASALIVIEDVTQQRVADESRGAFVTQASHELRNPLTTIRLYLEQLVEEGDKDPLVKARCLNVISSETRRLERIVSDMLSVSEMDAGTFKVKNDDVPLLDVFEEMKQDYQAQALDKEIELQFQMPPKLPLMVGDRDKIVMALHNLVGNAIKYTPTGGKVMVKVFEENASLLVDVTDTGIGIKDEEQELVFDKFYRSKDRRIASITGSGIGLALARQVVRLHGGDITLKSQLDKGSTFTMRLPITAPSAQMGKVAA